MNTKGFDNNFIELVKSKNDIVTVMSQYLTMQQKGKNFWTCCPFHNERTPSMAVNPYEQYYHCFGCKEHGDVITFVQKMESCDFMTALEILAKNANLEIPSNVMDSNVKDRKRQKDAILQILDAAYKHYEENLYKPTSKAAQEYIKKRKLTNSSLKTFHIGYSENRFEMIKYLRGKGFSYEDIKAAGIAEQNGTNDYVDTMGGRLMFPIFNIHDECIGFSARSLVPTDFAKYKNSTNNLVFDKSKNLFGINILKKLKQEHKLSYILLVEGQMDVIALNKAGFENSVACLGTALTEFHTKTLKYICEDIIISLDGDSAGQNATIKAINTLVQGGMNVKAIKIPENKDPDEYINEYGKEAYQKLLDEAKDYVEFLIYNKLEKFDLNKVDQKAGFLNACLEILNGIATNSEKQVYLEVIKNLTGIPIDVLKRDLVDKKFVPKVEDKQLDYFEDAEVKSIKFIMASLCHKKEYANFYFDLEKYLKNPTLRQLYQTLKEYNQKGEQFLISYLYDMFDVENEASIKDIIEYNFNDVPNAEEYYKACVWKIRESYLKQQIKELTEKSKNIEDTAQRLEVLKEVDKIQKKLRNKILED